MMVRPLYTVSFVGKKAGKPSDIALVHYSEYGTHTLCGKRITEDWFVLTYRRDGHANCTKCVAQNNRPTPTDDD